MLFIYYNTYLSFNIIEVEVSLNVHIDILFPAVDYFIVLSNDRGEFLADHIIDLGPEGGDAGGSIVFTGTPEDCARCAESYTGQFLKKELEG